MDENHDGQVSEEEFIEVQCDFISSYPIFHISHVQACMSQKKFSTMLTLKIIDVFVSSEWHPASGWDIQINIYFYYFMQIFLKLSFCHFSYCNFTETLQILRLPPPTCEHYCDHFVAFHSKYLDKSASALFQPLENEWKNVIVIKAFFLIIISFYIFIYLCVWCIYSFKPNNVLQNTGCQQYLDFNRGTQYTSFSIDHFSSNNICYI